ncbi:hypothetical protein GCM10010399_84030 [Dactylosporangium fulvum]|uniref:AB hydrolase-1 domain-containing protein n=1 Tax=Dactylosporangium fulvum TaxID=53359 RepID=A0ABY5VTT6_9ACTN|nr:hypothetical protein [Dactylosporangium fulvum]UWP80526.1 hypothetical protein Dfulv_35955 [Dactylosporangium fulvum]
MTVPARAVPVRAVENEFADLLARADPPPAVTRRWVNVTTGGHVSAVIWGTGAPQTVLLHDAGEDARSYDDLLSTVDIPAAAIDLPGHGRSNATSATPFPGRLARPVLEAIRSFAPRHRVLAGRGLGALVTLHIAARAPEAIGRLLLVDAPPAAEPLLSALKNPPQLVSPDELAAALAERGNR